MRVMVISRESNGHDVTSSNVPQNNVEVRIFCDLTVNNETNKLGIGCIVNDREGAMLAKFSKRNDINSPLLA